MRILLVILILLLAFLQYELWFAKGGVVNIIHLEITMKQLKQKNAVLIAQNQVLEADIDNLKHGDAAIEARARNGLGMIKQGEIFYQIVK